MQTEVIHKDVRFPTIKTDIVDRLAREAEERTLHPTEVDWKAIHAAAAAQGK